MIARIVFLLPALLLALTLQAQEEVEVIVIDGADAQDQSEFVGEDVSDETEGDSGIVYIEEVYYDTEGEDQASECDGPFAGKYVSRETIDQARRQGETDFCGADLSRADLSGAWLSELNLSGAMMMGTNLEGADLAFANLSGVQFEPLQGKLPSLDDIALAEGLSEMYFVQQPRALVSLRTQFRDAGYREQERQITYALKRSETANKLERLDEQPFFEYVLDVVDAGFNYVLFGLTTKWGLQPWRALVTVLVFIVLFSPAYWWALRNPRADGIWRVWDEFRQRQDLGKDDSDRPIQVHGMKAWRLALYFSLGSAFNIGWRELNVGNWISRVQRYEFTYKATGWPRTVSGIQSLLSVYLVAMWALTYFGRPFE